MSADVAVVGGGIAGCAAALAAARAGANVMLLTKLPDPDDTNTRWAQGGIIYTGPDDSPELLVKDVLAAGAGASSPEAARILATEGPQQVRELLIEELGVEFDHNGAGLSLAREGAHSAARILHQKDSTGWAIQRALAAAVRAERRVTPLYGAEALSLTVEDGRCVGLEVLLDGEAVQVRAISGACDWRARRLYAHTTNPDHATGDGVALAIQAGAAIRDLHFVQFHPTALYAADGDRFLVSEAVRGEGAVLLDADGQEFIEHPLGSLAARDVVAREMWEMLQRSGAPCAYLHVPSRSEGWFRERFPAIFAKCVEAGINVPDEPIPVTPAAHYSCGGVETDEHGRTSVRGLWAAGEVALAGLHGANRLASTSLLEGLVWGRRAGRTRRARRFRLRRRRPPFRPPSHPGLRSGRKCSPQGGLGSARRCGSTPVHAPATGCGAAERTCDVEARGRRRARRR
ncbi:MAG: FAD-dependent oxidoreductase [Chloroflexia bacterium]